MPRLTIRVRLVRLVGQRLAEEPRGLLELALREKRDARLFLVVIGLVSLARDVAQALKLLAQLARSSVVFGLRRPARSAHRVIRPEQHGMRREKLRLERRRQDTPRPRQGDRLMEQREDRRRDVVDRGFVETHALLHAGTADHEDPEPPVPVGRGAVADARIGRERTGLVRGEPVVGDDDDRPVVASVEQPAQHPVGFS